jgi:hypothetical protein
LQLLSHAASIKREEEEAAGRGGGGGGKGKGEATLKFLSGIFVTIQE